MKSEFNKKSALEDFDNFIFSMDDQIELLQSEALKYDFQLDLSKNSINCMEDCFDILVQPQKSVFDLDSLVVVFGRYLGEVLRLTVGGKWKLSIDDPKNIYFNKPVIVGHRAEGVEFSPISVMRAYAIRRAKGMIQRAFEHHSTPPQRLDLSHLAELESVVTNPPTLTTSGVSAVAHTCRSEEPAPVTGIYEGKLPDWHADARYYNAAPGRFCFKEKGEPMLRMGVVPREDEALVVWTWLRER